ncbi:MAG: D-glycero-beta-D-manno-heptose 1-phosphate adenylyltransferase [Saprospiraceae bacterium]|nr:D-glycero-beta-D-manno-heptose 1-phosphate adenylyltransferase [Saprospiraceae bacterium]
MLEAIKEKISSHPDAQHIVATWKENGERIAWTNGVFDILHQGHIKYLCAARSLADRLVVGLNTDASVQKIKGPSRPVIDQKSRALKLAALQMVDLVVFFNQETPLDLIIQLRPDFLIKGGDYRPADIIGADFVTGYGGQVKVIPFEAGHSTSKIIEKIQNLPL